MKLTKSQLKQIIKEELVTLLEGSRPLDWRKGRHNPFTPDFESSYGPGWFADEGGHVDPESDDYADRYRLWIQSQNRSPEENQERYQEWFGHDPDRQSQQGNCYNEIHKILAFSRPRAPKTTKVACARGYMATRDRKDNFSQK